MLASRLGRLLVVLLALAVGVLVGAAVVKHRLGGGQGLLPGSLVLMVSPPAGATGDEMDAMWARSIRTHAQMLQSDEVLHQVLLGQGSKTPVSGASNRQKLPALRKMLSVRIVPGTALIEVRADAADDSTARVWARGVADAYLAWLRGQADKDEQRKIQVLRNLKDLYWNQLRDLQDRERQLQTDLTAKGMAGPGRLSVLDLQLQSLVEHMLAARRKAADAQAMLDTVLMQLAQNLDPPQIEQMIEQDARIRQLISQIDQVDIRRSVERLRVPADDPSIARMDAEKEALQRKLREVRDENHAKAIVKLTNQLRSEAAATMEEYKKAKDLLDEVKAEIAELSAQMATYLTIVEDRKAVQALYHQVSEQLQNLLQNAQVDSPLPVAIVSRP